MTTADMLVTLGVDPEIAEQAAARWHQHSADEDVAELLAYYVANNKIKAICYRCGAFWTGRVPAWVTHQTHCYACFPRGCEGSTVDDNRTSDVDGTRVQLPTAPQDGAA